MLTGRVALIALVLVVPSVVGQQPSRLGNDEPEVRIDAGGRNGVCDVLTFTPDGRTLLAAGEDKTVHRWTVARGDRLTLTPGPSPLFWNTFRERKGNIYALALDPAGRRVAVAGLGKLDPDVAILDLATGQVVAALSPSAQVEPAGSAYLKAQHAVWALAWRSDGRELAVGDEAGNVWLWRTDDNGAGRVRLAAAGEKQPTEGSRVVWVGYPGGRLAFARRDGGVYAADGGKPLHRWGPAVGMADRVVASGDGRVLAARPLRGHAGNGVEVWRPVGGTTRTVLAPREQLPERIALDATGQRLAIGYIDYTNRPPTGFKYDRPGEVCVYDLSADPPRVLARHPFDMCPDQIVFHPTDDRLLAVAESAAHDTSLWQIVGTDLKRIDTESSGIRPIWAVGLTTDGRHLSFKTDRNPLPTHPNHRAAVAGKWVTFDLTHGRRGWSGEPKPPVPPADTRAGWRVEFNRNGTDYQWTVVEPNGTPHPMDSSWWDKLRDDLPRCYTFLPGPNNGVRLAIGHLWGASVYDLRPGQKPVRVRKLTGHAGYVTAIAPTHGGHGLVTAGRDQTVAFWSLADFSHQPVLGAAFAERNGQVVVEAVADGSPADEAGLSRGDVVAGLVSREYLPTVKRTVADTPALKLSLLRSARPFAELAFTDLRRPGRPNDQLQARTLGQHRPVAKFVPLGRGEWVLYTYRQCYYDASANGDRAVQWLVSKNRADQTPDVQPVGDFKGMLNKPDRVTAVLANLQAREKAAPALVEKFPPRVEVMPAAPVVAGAANLRVTVRVTPRNNHLGLPNVAERVELWANGDTRVGQQVVAARPAPARGEPFALRAQEAVDLVFDVPNAALSAGPNSLQGAALARDGGWGTASKPALVQLTDPPARPRRLYVLSVGVGDYFENKQPSFINLDSPKDAKRLRDAWSKLAADGQSGFAPADVEQVRLMVDGEVTREAVTAAIRAIGQKVQGDDLFVLGLSGHGVLGDREGYLFRTPDGKRPAQDTWYYAIPQTAAGDQLDSAAKCRDGRFIREAFLSDAVLFEALAAVPCRKLVLLDCCHSGKAVQAGDTPSVTKNTAMGFRRNGFGPVVLAACAANEESIEDPRSGGVFTTTLVEAITPDRSAAPFSLADANGDGRLTARELAGFLTDRAKKLAEEITNPRTMKPHVQNAQYSPGLENLGRLLVAEKKVGRNPAKSVGGGQ